MKRKNILKLVSISLGIAIVILAMVLSYADIKKEIFVSNYYSYEQEDSMVAVRVETSVGVYQAQAIKNATLTNHHLDQEKSYCLRGGTIEYTDGKLIVHASSYDRCYAYFSMQTFADVVITANGGASTILAKGEPDFTTPIPSAVSSSAAQNTVTVTGSEVINFCRSSAADMWEAGNATAFKCLSPNRDSDTYSSIYNSLVGKTLVTLSYGGSPTWTGLTTVYQVTAATATSFTYTTYVRKYTPDTTYANGVHYCSQTPAAMFNNGTYNCTSTVDGTYSSVYSSLTNKVLSSLDFNSTTATWGSTVYLVTNAVYLSSNYGYIGYIPYGSASSGGLSTTGSGMYGASYEESGNSFFYFRGVVENNYVNFAGKTWRIMSINADRSVRLVYKNNVSGYKGSYRSSVTDGMQAAYSGTQPYTNTDSNAKTKMDAWYTANITGANLDKVYRASAPWGFCNNLATGDVDENNYYFQNYSRYKDYSPPYICHGLSNRLRVGNGYLQKPIAMPSFDELIMAGLVGTGDTLTKAASDASTQNFMNFDDVVYWTLTPAKYVDNNGTITIYMYTSWLNSTNQFQNSASGSMYFFPVIDIKPSVRVTSGTGTSASPYVI